MWREDVGGRYRGLDGFQGWGVTEYKFHVNISSRHFTRTLWSAWAGWSCKWYRPTRFGEKRAGSKERQLLEPTHPGEQKRRRKSASPNRTPHQRTHLLVLSSPGWLCVCPFCLTLFSSLLLEKLCPCGKVDIRPWNLTDQSSNPRSVTLFVCSRLSYLSFLSSSILGCKTEQNILTFQGCG